MTYNSLLQELGNPFLHVIIDPGLVSYSYSSSEWESCLVKSEEAQERRASKTANGWQQNRIRFLANSGRSS